ncbi:histidine kinase [Elizabethkingia argentiflava]|uniref:Histidine kinase n=1 Tax=Elizabethkingia argenteiflava TaxID=2681556 RepID=A0A845PTC0_9FLAO|nr:histidine kinase [Elizabethkingia argenteiflava]NAW50281.1 histidine kinase [Elizabethkingia argenteiflava]
MNHTNLIHSNHPLMLAFIVGLLIIIAFFVYKIRCLQIEKTILLDEKEILKNKLKNINLDYIETKLNPHLFKNILNSVQSHAYQTYVSLDKLSGVLDYILYESSERFVTPESELDFTLNLIEINKVKINPLFNFRIKSQIDKLHPIYKEKVLAPLITVDFIENAFKHTDFLAEDAFIFIFLSLQNGILEIKVENKISNKSPLLKDHSGFGSGSLEPRLKKLYKKNFSVKKEIQHQVYTAYLKINLNDKYNQVRYTR